MKWLKRIVTGWVREDWDNARDEIVAVNRLGFKQSVSNRSVDADGGFRINVYRARGGTVIETSLYDQIKERDHRGLFVVTDDKDLGEELGKIITMENLRS
jgi:hypothetical protein